MSMTRTEIPDTQNRESDGLTRTLTETPTDPTKDQAQEADAHLPGDCTTAEPATEGVNSATALARTPGGYLTFRPDQTALTDDQRAAFRSLGVDPSDPVAVPYARRFVHVCQQWGVDPWSGEIHLVERGKKWTRDNGKVVDNRTWTIQTGIDGYRRRARQASEDPGCPVRMIGKAKWYWSYGDDDPQGRGWTPVRDPDTGDMVMQPIWYAAWPDGRDNPALAKAVIVVEVKSTGERRVEEFVANWKMFAAYEDEYEGTGNSRKKKLDNQGNPVKKLGTFWAKGGAHMLGKVAEAQVLRATFHGYFHGVYATEEMHQADAEAVNSLEEAVARNRREAYRKNQEAAITDPVKPAPMLTATVEPVAPQAAHQAAGQADAEPVHISQALTETLTLSEDERRRLLLEEIDWIGELLEQNVLNAIVRRARKNVEELSSSDLLAQVGPFRESVVIPRLREAGRNDEADSYATFGTSVVAPVAVLTGRELPPVSSHAFDAREDNDSRCSKCDGFEDDPVHVGATEALPS